MVSNISYLVGHLAMLVLCLTLKTVCPIHILRLMVPSIDVHAFRVQP